MSALRSPSSSAALTSEQLSHLSADAQAWSITHSLLIAAPSSGSSASSSVAAAQPQLFSMVHAPCTLFPSPLPRSVFEFASSLCKPFNTLVDRVSRNRSFLRKTLKETCLADPFTDRLMQIMNTIEEDEHTNPGKQQDKVLAIHRSDYMLHNDADIEKMRVYQVEINTISSSFGCLSTRAHKLHRYLAERYAHSSHAGINPSNIPLSDSENTIPAALASAHHLALKDVQSKGWTGPSVVVMVVQPGERNIGDQRLVEFNLYEQHKVLMIRLTLAELVDTCTLDEATRVLQVNSNGTIFAVTVVYYRAGYTPNDYPSEKEWAGRLLAEKSIAIKCPNIGYHLAGTKKIQEQLAQPEQLEQFLSSQEDCSLLRRCFTGLYSLQDQAAVDRAAEHYHDYVLKPQREGGGNLIVGEEMRDMLRSLTEEQRAAYTLMQRIVPPIVEITSMRNGAISQFSAVYELGIYGLSIFGGDSSEHLNQNGGYLLRTKGATQEDGGVASGVAVLDSAYLI